MSGQLEIAALIEKRMRELGLSRADLAARLGYRQLREGMGRIEEVCQGQLERHSENCGKLTGCGFECVRSILPARARSTRMGAGVTRDLNLAAMAYMRAE